MILPEGRRSKIPDGFASQGQFLQYLSMCFQFAWKHDVEAVTGHLQGPMFPAGPAPLLTVSS